MRWILLLVVLLIGCAATVPETSYHRVESVETCAALYSYYVDVEKACSDTSGYTNSTDLLCGTIYKNQIDCEERRQEAYRYACRFAAKYERACKSFIVKVISFHRTVEESL